jgi:hypothetical protein
MRSEPWVLARALLRPRERIQSYCGFKSELSFRWLHMPRPQVLLAARGEIRAQHARTLEEDVNDPILAEIGIEMDEDAHTT